MNALYEKTAVYLAIFLAIGIMMGGIAISIESRKFEWMNRAGALVVCFEGLVILIDLSRKHRVEAKLEGAATENPFVEEELRKSETGFMLTGVSLAIVGELLHGFGDIMLESALSGISGVSKIIGL